MRNFSIILLGVLLVGCGSYRPVSYSGPIAGAMPQAMDCVRREFEQLGYTVTASEPTASSITAVRVEAPPWYRRFLGFQSTANQITAAVSQGELQVTAVSTDPTSAYEGGRAETGDGANEQAERDTRQIVGACTTGP